MVSQSITKTIWQGLRKGMGRVIRALTVGILSGIVLIELAAAFFNRTAGEAAAFTMINGSLQFNGSVFTGFVHVTALAFGLTLGVAAAVITAVVQTLQGIIFAAEHVDDVAGAVVDRGLDVVDAAVDALDGPDRHGFRGKRGSTVTTS